MIHVFYAAYTGAITWWVLPTQEQLRGGRFLHRSIITLRACGLYCSSSTVSKDTFCSRARLHPTPREAQFASYFAAGIQHDSLGR